MGLLTLDGLLRGAAAAGRRAAAGRVPYYSSYARWPRPGLGRMSYQGRDTFVITRRIPRSKLDESTFRLPLGFNYLSNRPRMPPQNMDRRYFHPMGALAPAVTTDGLVSKVVEIDPDTWRRIHRPLKPLRMPRPGRVVEAARAAAAVGKFGFMNAIKTAICVKRAQRREIFHALRKAGKIGQRPPKFDAFSWVRC